MYGLQSNGGCSLGDLAGVCDGGGSGDTYVNSRPGNDRLRIICTGSANKVSAMNTAIRI